MTSTNLPLKYVAMSKVGLGYDASSLERLMRLDPAFIGADAGSNDVGPYQLAGVSPYLSETACTRDLRGALLAARAAGVPFLVGSCGGSGRDWGVDWFAGIIRRVAKEEGLRPFKLARIYTEVDPATIIEKLRAGAVKPLEPHIPYDEEIIRRSVRIVAVIGAEPFMAALESGADVVLAGRACDTAIFAAVPLRAGVPAPAAWFASKTAEAGYGAQVPSKSEPTLLSVDNDGFTVEPGALRSVCTVASVASAGLHEESDPTKFIQPGGVIDASQARYEAVDHRTVRVSGARFVPRRYTIKLEGVELAGYQSIVMVSYRDPVALESLKEWVADLPAQYHKHIERTFGPEIHDKYTITMRVYGQNGTMGGP